MAERQGDGKAWSGGEEAGDTDGRRERARYGNKVKSRDKGCTWLQWHWTLNSEPISPRVKFIGSGDICFCPWRGLPGNGGLKEK